MKYINYCFILAVLLTACGSEHTSENNNTDTVAVTTKANEAAPMVSESLDTVGADTTKPKEVVGQSAPGANAPAENAQQIYDNPEVPAEFTGGMPAMTKYISTNIRYPQTMKQQGLSGKCYLNFVVQRDGRIESVRVLRGVPNCPEADNEAVRIVKSMPKWRPGTIDGKPVPTYFNLPISFVVR